MARQRALHGGQLDRVGLVRRLTSILNDHAIFFLLYHLPDP
jgi:hypothetical protein